MQNQDKQRGNPVHVLLWCISVSVIIIECCLFFWLTGLLSSQKQADRWSDEGGVSQLSVYFSNDSALTAGEQTALSQALTRSAETALQASANSPVSKWPLAYSAQGTADMTRGTMRQNVLATAVGGDYFTFHRVPLVSGSYFDPTGSNDDLILIDEDVAWKLFSSTDVVGMEVQIDRLPCRIAGVFRCEENFASKASYGDTPRVILSYGAMVQLDTDAQTDTGDITAYYALLPDLVTGSARTMLEEAIGKDRTHQIVENTRRYELSNLFDVLRSFPTRSNQSLAVAYPYTENAARMTENGAAALLLLIALTGLPMLITTVVLVVGKGRRRTWRARNVMKTVVQKITKEVQHHVKRYTHRDHKTI